MAEDREAVLLTTPPDVAPRTQTGAWGVVMKLASGSSDTLQWFDYKPEFFGPSLRVEWPAGTMMATVPQKDAEVLLRDGYARAMTQDEARVYNAAVNRSRRAEAKESAAA